MTWFGQSPREERLWVEALERGRARARAAAAAWDEADVLQASRIATNAPWMNPGTLLGLVKGNASPRAIAAAARVEAAPRIQTPDRPRGYPVDGFEMLPGHRRLLDEDENWKEGQRTTSRAAVLDDAGPMGGGSISEEDMNTEFIRDYQRASEGMGRARPTTQAQADWRAEQRLREELRGSGVLAEDGTLQSPIPLSMALRGNNLVDPDEVPADKREAYSRFVTILRSLHEDGQALDDNGYIGFSDPEGERFRYWFNEDEGKDRFQKDIEAQTVNPFDYRAALETVAAPFAAAAEAIGGLPTPQGMNIGESLQMEGRNVSRDLENYRLQLPEGPGPLRGLTDAGNEQLQLGGFGGSLREGVQRAGMGANAPVQEFQGLVRNIYGQATGRTVDWWEPQSDLGIAEFTGMDPGNGLLVDPDSEVAQERLRREAERGMIFGQRVTLGRLLAGGAARLGVIEPGSAPYRVMSGLVDFGVQVGDPFARGSAGLAASGARRTLFQGAQEVGEELPEMSTTNLRSLASSLGVTGRSGMGRDQLLQTIHGAAPRISDMNTQQVRGLAARFNIPGRTRMPRDQLVERVTDQVANVGVQRMHPAVPPGTDPSMVPPSLSRPMGEGEARPATSWAGATARGLAESSRVTGIPWAARKFGLIKGNFTDGVHGPTSDYWMAGREGTARRSLIAETKDPLVMDRLFRKKLHPIEIAALVDTNTADEVTDVLRPMLGTSLRHTTDVAPVDRGGQMWDNIASPVNSLMGGDGLIPMAGTLKNSRFLQDTPGQQIDLDDPRSALDETVAWMKNAHFSDEEISPYFDRLTRAANRNEIFDTIAEVMEATDGVLARAGVGQSDRVRMTQTWRRQHQDAQDWFLSEVTEQQSLFNDVDVGGTVLRTGNPHEWQAAYDRFVFLPDFREVRRVLSKHPNVAWDASGQLHKPASMVMGMQEDIWKPFTLLRVAWPVRVIGEEQLRMATADWASVTKSPLSAIAYAIARKTDPEGTNLDDVREFLAAQNQRTNGWLNDRPGRVRTAKEKTFHKGDQGYDAVIGDKIVQLHKDPLARFVANSDSEDEAVDWLMNGQGRPHFERMRREHPEMYPRVDNPEPLARQAVRNAQEWNNYITGGNDELLHSIRTGKVRSKRSVAGRTIDYDIESGDGLPTGHFTRSIAQRFSDATPAAVTGYEDLANAAYRGETVERMFGFLFSKPNNFLSRNPLWKQAHQQRMVELTSFMTPEAKAGLLLHGGLAERHLGINIKNYPKHLRQQIEDTPANGRLTLAEANDYAKGYALDEVKHLLYEASRRSQFFDANRLLFPFGEAWREVITRWADIANPLKPQGWKSLRRFQQTIQGARGQDLGELAGAPEGEGFFWKDEFGEEVFVYPGSQWMNRNITGLFGEANPVPLVGQVKGLSMFGQLIPGIGPAAAIPVTAFIEDEPGWQRTARNWLFPFGHPTERAGLTAAGQALSYAPPWLRHGVTALTGGGYDQETNRIFANSVMSTANYLYSTGKYDTTSEDGRSKLLADARSQAKLLTMVRALSSFVAPAAPQIEFVTETDEGIQFTAHLVEDYHRLIEEVGYEQADETFLDRWGEAAGMTMQAKTREVTRGLEPTSAFGDWTRSDQGSYLQENYPAIWGFFGPDGGEFDNATYVRQLRSGDREQLSEREWLNMGENHLGQILMDHLVASLPNPEDMTDDDRAFKREIEAEIVRQYPGFGDYTGTEGRASPETIRRQIDAAVNDDRVLDTEVGEALSLYWEARNSSLDVAAGMGLAVTDVTYDLSRADSLAEEREFLFDIGEELASRHPAFSRFWDRQLRFEVQED